MNIRNLLEEKREWRNYKSRIKALPKEYQIVYNEMEKYFFKVCCANNIDNSTILPGVLELFEESAAMKQSVLKITGEDIAAFCDSLLA